MYTLSRRIGLRRAVATEGPWLVLSWAIAEIFYKFHSFTLECGAFLGTWFVLSLLASLVDGQLRRIKGAGPASTKA